MKPKFLPFLLIISAAFFYSCQRDVTDTLPNRVVNDSIVLWKYAELDTTLPGGLDTLDVYYFEYDAQDRISRILNYYRDDTSPSSAYPYNTISNFFYNGNDTFPNKIIRRTEDLGFIITDTSYYAYQNELVTMDSLRGLVSRPSFPYRLITVRYFTNTGNNTQMLERLSKYFVPDPPPASPCTSTYIIAKTYSNGNISSENGTATGCTIGGWDDQYVYDNKINPFHAIELPYPINSFTNFNTQKNNLTEENSVSQNMRTRYAYTYRADGYPLVMRAKDLLDPSVNWKGIYFYTR